VERVERLQLLAGHKSGGQPVYEELLVEPQSDNRYKLLKSPGLVLGLGAGDVFERAVDGTFFIIEQGGNICVQIFARADLISLEQFVTPQLSCLGGYLDGKTERQLVYTVPAVSGFEPLEAILNEITSRWPDAEWYYGNVYDPSDGLTPLGWWEEE
jgi:hypothetical protein